VIAHLMAKYRDTQFKWGCFDCAQFAIDALRTLHGINVSLPNYNTEREAIRVLKSLGGFSNALKDMGLMQIPAQLSQRGDLLIIENDDEWGRALALNVGNGAACPAEVGLKIVWRYRWVEAWRPACLN
jgi:hypothetical protein